MLQPFPRVPATAHARQTTSVELSILLEYTRGCPLEVTVRFGEQIIDCGFERSLKETLSRLAIA
jgi:hypothetical protein